MVSAFTSLQVERPLCKTGPLRRARDVGRNEQAPTHLGELLLQVLPLLAVGLAQLLPLPDEQAQLVQGPRVQVFRVLPQQSAQALRLTGDLCPGLRHTKGETACARTVAPEPTTQGTSRERKGQAHIPGTHRNSWEEGWEGVKRPWNPTWLMGLSGPPRLWPPLSCRDMWCSRPAYSRSLLTRWAIHFLMPSSSRSSASCIC